ncbi:MAG: PspC domain-containing protein [Terriglobales bacterium]
MDSRTVYCNACGNALTDQASFCSHCGRSVAHPHAPARMMRPRHDRKIAGVCAAFAEHLDLDVSLVRILWIFLTFASGFFPGLIAYILAWIIIPEEPYLLTTAPYQPPNHQQPVAG